MRPDQTASALLQRAIESALILPYRNSPSVSMHLDLRWTGGHVLLSAEAQDVSDGGEAFYLVASDLDLSDWWAHQWTTEWEPRDLVRDWSGTSLGELLSGPRTARFFFDPEDRALGLRAAGIFESAAAVELSSAAAGPAPSIVLFASPDFTFSIEIATFRGRQKEILARLVEFTPSAFRRS